MKYIEIEKSKLRAWEKSIVHEKEEKVTQKKKEEEAENQKAIEKAKRTGRNVFVRQMEAYDGDSDPEARRKFGEECGIILVHEIATPEGKIITQESACY